MVYIKVTLIFQGIYSYEDSPKKKQIKIRVV
jgi:hypothetical protein